MDKTYFILKQVTFDCFIQPLGRFHVVGQFTMAFGHNSSNKWG